MTELISAADPLAPLQEAVDALLVGLQTVSNLPIESVQSYEEALGLLHSTRTIAREAVVRSVKILLDDLRKGAGNAHA